MFNRLSGATRLFPIGDRIKYVESPMHLTSTFGARDYNGICVPMQVPADDLDAVMVGLVAARNVDGILVTMPHKFTAFALCATSSERTKMLGVVSVIRRNPDRTWHGDMLDGLAFVKAQKDHGAQPEGARVLLVGAGGAGRAIAIALLEARVGEHITKRRTRTPRRWTQVHPDHCSALSERISTVAELLTKGLSHQRRREAIVLADRSTPGSVRAPASDGWCATRCSGVGIRRCAGCWVAVLMRCSRRANSLRHQLTRPLSAFRTCQLLSASRAMSRSC